MSDTIGLRPCLPTDAEPLAQLFRASIAELTGEDYSEAQQAEWIARADDEEAFGRRLAGGLTLVAVVSGEPVGFITLKGTDLIDMLYVRPDCAGAGVGTTLCDAIERLAGARKASVLTVDASDTARDFFEKRGYRAQRRNTVALGDEWLANTTMSKTLPPVAGGTV